MIDTKKNIPKYDDYYICTILTYTYVHMCYKLFHSIHKCTSKMHIDTYVHRYVHVHRSIEDSTCVHMHDSHTVQTHVRTHLG